MAPTKDVFDQSDCSISRRYNWLDIFCYALGIVRVLFYDTFWFRVSHNALACASCTGRLNYFVQYCTYSTRYLYSSSNRTFEKNVGRLRMQVDGQTPPQIFTTYDVGRTKYQNSDIQKDLRPLKKTSSCRLLFFEHETSFFSSCYYYSALLVLFPIRCIQTSLRPGALHDGDCIGNYCYKKLRKLSCLEKLPNKS